MNEIIKLGNACNLCHGFCLDIIDIVFICLITLVCYKIFEAILKN